MSIHPEATALEINTFTTQREIIVGTANTLVRFALDSPGA
jgi:hypothetical protein